MRIQLLNKVIENIEGPVHYVQYKTFKTYSVFLPGDAGYSDKEES